MEMAAMTTMKGGESSGLKLCFWKLGFIDGGCAAEEVKRGRKCGGGGGKELGFFLDYVFKPGLYVNWFSL